MSRLLVIGTYWPYDQTTLYAVLSSDLDWEVHEQILDVYVMSSVWTELWWLDTSNMVLSKSFANLMLWANLWRASCWWLAWAAREQIFCSLAWSEYDQILEQQLIWKWLTWVDLIAVIDEYSSDKLMTVMSNLTSDMTNDKWW